MSSTREPANPRVAKSSNAASRMRSLVAAASRAPIGAILTNRLVSRQSVSVAHGEQHHHDVVAERSGDDHRVPDLVVAEHTWVRIGAMEREEHGSHRVQDATSEEQ